MKIEVRRITEPNLFQEVASMTTGKPCKMSWLKALKSGHSNALTVAVRTLTTYAAILHLESEPNI